LKTLINILIILSFIQYKSIAQQVELITDLPDEIKETSGLILLNDHLLTHNDSGGESSLFEIDTLSGRILNSKVIENAPNKDWEDICHDNTHIYIGDFGNNSGSRTDLKIYRISIDEYFSNDTLTADTIQFSYADQSDFTPSTYSTNFDAEALIAYKEKLYIFTKNWSDGWSNIYSVPKDPGNYEIQKIDSLDAGGLITGATYNSASNTILLCGYNLINPFIIEISDFSNDQFSHGSVIKSDLTVDESIQIEGITWIRKNEYYLSAEENFTGGAALYKLELDKSSKLETLKGNDLLIYPNPAYDSIHVEYFEDYQLEIFNQNGILIKSTQNKQIDISQFEAGSYNLVIKNRNNEIVTTRLLIVH